MRVSVVMSVLFPGVSRVPLCVDARARVHVRVPCVYVYMGVFSLRRTKRSRGRKKKRKEKKKQKKGRGIVSVPFDGTVASFLLEAITHAFFLFRRASSSTLPLPRPRFHLSHVSSATNDARDTMKSTAFPGELSVHTARVLSPV